MSENALEDYPLVTDDDLDPDFPKRVISTPGGENLRDCFTCGTCTVSCPIRAIDDTFNPRRIIRQALLGLRDEVLQSEIIWICTACFTCQERCPQDVRITDLMMAFRNLATEEGYPHPTVKAITEGLMKDGIIMEIGEYENEKRAKMGLPPRNVPPDAVLPIIESTGLKHSIDNIKGDPTKKEDDD